MLMIHQRTMQNIIYLTQANYTAQGWRSLVKRDGLKIRWLRSTGVQNNIYGQISLPAHYVYSCFSFMITFTEVL